MNKETCFHLGHFSKVRGYKGDLVLFIDSDFPEHYAGLPALFAEVNGHLVPYSIERIEIKDKGFAYVKLEMVDDEETARALSTCQVFLPEEMLPELGDQQFYFHEVKGYTVEDVNFGVVGQLEEVIDQGPNPLLSVKVGEKEVLIPMRDEFIRNVDKPGKTITVEAPSGLIDLYLSEDAQQDEE